MSHSSQSSRSSLIHLHRPSNVDNSVDHCRQTVNSHQEDLTGDEVNSMCSSPTSSIVPSTSIFFPPRAGPSMKSDAHSKVDTKSTSPVLVQRPFPMRRASTDPTSTTTSASTSLELVESCADLLRAMTPTVRVAKTRSEWQPDEDSALCNFPLCSTMFGQTSLSLGPRRHHCRYCGLIFCGSHTTSRQPLQTTDSKGRPVVQPLRVCDGCRSDGIEDICTLERRSSDTAPSLTDSAISAPDEILVTPGSEMINPLALARSFSHASIDDLNPRLAPIQEWMDRSGVLSLYPLAIRPSHSRRAHSPHTRAVGPLFAPTLSERRSAKEKEWERVSLRQRRMGRDKPAFSIRGKWGYGGDCEDGDECHGRLPADSLVVDGPFVFRSRSKDRSLATTDGTTTPQERELDWSTF